MPTREERLARNEARFREINEAAQPQREQTGEGRFVCECADRSCLAWIEIPVDIYLEQRKNPQRFFVVPGHEVPDVEKIVEQHPGFYVVEKPEEARPILE